MKAPNKEYGQEGLFCKDLLNMSIYNPENKELKLIVTGPKELNTLEDVEYEAVLSINEDIRTIVNKEHKIAWTIKSKSTNRIYRQQTSPNYHFSFTVSPSMVNDTIVVTANEIILNLKNSVEAKIKPFYNGEVLFRSIKNKLTNCFCFHLIVIKFDSLKSALVFKNAHKIQFIKGQDQYKEEIFYITLEGFYEDGFLKCEFNKESNASSDVKSLKINPPNGMKSYQFIEKIITLAKNYRQNEFSIPIDLEFFLTLPAAWEYTLLTKAGINNDESEKIGDFLNEDLRWNEEHDAEFFYSLYSMFGNSFEIKIKPFFKGKVYWAVRDLDGIPVGNHHLIIIKFESFKSASVFQKIHKIIYIHEQSQFKDEHYFMTIATFNEDILKCKFNQKADIQSMKEDILPQWSLSDFDLEAHIVYPPNNMKFHQFIEKIITLAKNYRSNELLKPIDYTKSEYNCAAWVNALFKKAGISKDERRKKSDFFGLDVGEDFESAQLDSMFDSQ